MKILNYRNLIIALAVLSFISLFIGVGQMSLTGLFNSNSEEWSLLWQSRLPRLVAILVAGASLSICGLVMQSLTQNRFVSPTTTGLFDWARLGVLLAIILFPDSSLLVKSIFAILATWVGSFLFIMVLNSLKKKDIVLVPLIGMILGGIVSAFTTFLALRFELLQNLTTWLQGDFSSVLHGNYELIYLSIPALFIIYFYTNKFILVGMGEDISTSLGINYKKTIFIGLGLVAIITSCVIISTGAIPFLGLIVPNIVSIYLGDNIRNTLPYTAIIGALLVLCCDILGRIVIFPYEVSVSVIMGILGSIIFIWLIVKRHRHGEHYA